MARSVRIPAAALPVLTQRWRADQLAEAALALRSGKAVAFPTETVYGLGADAFSDVAVKRIFDAKGRPSDNPLIVHVADFAAALALVELDLGSRVGRDVQALAGRFWPGPLTLVLPKRAALSPLATAGLATVGVRVPDHPIALELLRLAACPIAAPSANTSGRPSPTSADHVLHDLDARIDGIVLGGNAGVGLESTVLDCCSRPYTVLRPGAVTVDQLQRLLGADNVRVGTTDAVDDESAPRAPGMKYQHYAPTAPVHYVKRYERDLGQLVREATVERGQVVALLTPEAKAVAAILPPSEIPSYQVQVVQCGASGDLESIARDLYACLRRFDEVGQGRRADVIFAFAFPEHGLGQAIMNRILKASTTIVE